MGECLRAETTPAFVSRKLPGTLIAATEVRADRPELAMSMPIPREDAYVVAMMLREFPIHEYWENGRQSPVGRLPQECICIYDLKRSPTFLMNNPFHSVHFYLPRKALAAISDNVEARPIGELRYTPGAGVDDGIMRALDTALLPVFETPQQASSLFIEHVMLAVGTHLARTYGGVKIVHPAHRLDDRRLKRVLDYVEDHLSDDIAVADLASVACLSIFHFTRAFSSAIGVPPHRYVSQRRLEWAKGMIAAGGTSIAETAFACRFSSQSSFTRAFLRATGMTPAEYRRASAS